MANNKPHEKRRKKQARLEAREKDNRSRWLRIGGIVVIVFMTIAGFALLRNFALQTAEAEAATAPPNLIGPADALVRIVEYGDFGCHACRSWHSMGIKDQLLAEYGEQISFEFRHFPVITQLSPHAAEAAECAAEQGGFWPYHDYIYEQTREGDLSDDSLRAFAAAVGLDQDGFNSCLDSGRYEESVRIDWRDAQKAGARGTPTFLVNDRQAFPTYNGLAEAIDSALGNN